ncbi:MAG: hypothetical protein QOD41_4394 [Cryptosporangiaceae bacterium]|jgi:NTE family protein|nr:hypothetical protein [Cryptosporangiaceae bacterium]
MGGLGLVLSGGGAPAAYFGAGVARAIEDLGLTPDVVSGVSAGALNAAALGHGLTATELAAMWESISWHDIYGIRTDVWNAVDLRGLFTPGGNPVERALDSVGWTWLLDTSPGERTLARHLGADESGQFTVQAGRTLVVSAVEQASGEVVRFCSALPPRSRRSDGGFKRVRISTGHVLASAAVPLLFPPGRIGTKTYVDAGLVANTPLAPVMAYEPDAVIIVSGAGVARPARDPRTWGEAIELLADNVAYFSLMADYKHALTVNTLAAAAPGATAKRHVPMLLISPSELGFSLGGFLRFTAEDARRVIEYGRREATGRIRRWLTERRRAAG